MDVDGIIFIRRDKSKEATRDHEVREDPEGVPNDLN
jgi:hypothetical protein